MYLLAMLAFLFGAGTETAASQRYTVDRWDVDDGLPNNALSDLIQSRDGYLWIATWAGVVRFDGVRFTPVAEDLPNDHARALFEDRDGAMWIGVSGAGLVRWRAGLVEALTEADGLAGHDVRALAEDGEGRIWAGTENGVSVIEPRPFDSSRRELTPGKGRITTYRVEQGLPANDINGLARGRDGQMWIATAKGVCAAKRHDLRCERLALFSGSPNAVLEDRLGRLWVGTDAGLFSEGFDPTPFAGQSVNVLLPSNQGGLWVGFLGGVVALVDARGIERYGAADGLPAGRVVAIYEDPEGSVWVATDNGGLTRLKPKRVTMYSTAEGLPSNVIGSVVQDGAGTIWAGTQCGPVSELVAGRFVPRFTEYTKDACARVLWPARDGSLWIGTNGSGVFRWSGGRMEHFGPSNGLSDTRITALFEDRDGVMWIGTEFGGVHTYANGRLSRGFGRADGVATELISSFAQDRDGRVWIGSNANGLSVYEGGRFRMLSPAESPPTRNIAGLVVDSRGDLWIGSAANGLFRRRHGRYEPFGVAQGLGDRLIAVVVEDRDANLWVCTARGISRLERAKIEAVAEGRAASLEPIILDRADGLLNPEGSGGGLDPSGLRDREGRIWISTIGGIAVIDPASFPTNAIPPRVLIEGATLGDRPAAQDKDGTIEVPAGTESIELTYTAFSLLAPPKVRFKYRLDGFDAQWHDVGSRRTAYYPRLPPGSHRFEVLAANNDGLWSTSPAAIALTRAAVLVGALAGAGGRAWPAAGRHRRGGAIRGPEADPRRACRARAPARARARAHAHRPRPARRSGITSLPHRVDRGRHRGVGGGAGRRRDARSAGVDGERAERHRGELCGVRQPACRGTPRCGRPHASLSHPDGPRHPRARRRDEAAGLSRVQRGGQQRREARPRHRGAHFDRHRGPDARRRGGRRRLRIQRRERRSDRHRARRHARETRSHRWVGRADVDAGGRHTRRVSVTVEVRPRRRLACPCDTAPPPRWSTLSAPWPSASSSSKTTLNCATRSGRSSTRRRI